MVSAFVLIAGIGWQLFLLSMVNVHPISFVNYLDGVGLLEMFVILVLSLWCAGRLRDFKNAFQFLFWGDEKFCEAKESKALESYNIEKSSTVMIGDREHDIIGAKENNLDSIGVLYGYGSRDELKNAGAMFLVEKPLDISEYV